MDRVVIDTNIFVSAVMNNRGTPRQVLRLALEQKIKPLFGNALFSEYEDLLSRDSLFEKSLLSPKERDALFDALLSVSTWVPIYYLWRPNLRDEADNHLIELALAGGAQAVITNNKRDLASGDLRLGGLSILMAGEYMKDRSDT